MVKISENYKKELREEGWSETEIATKEEVLTIAIEEKRPVQFQLGDDGKWKEKPLV